MKRHILTKNKTKCGGKSKKNGLLRIKNTGSLKQALVNARKLFGSIGKL